MKRVDLGGGDVDRRRGLGVRRQRRKGRLRVCLVGGGGGGGLLVVENGWIIGGIYLEPKKNLR